MKERLELLATDEPDELYSDEHDDWEEERRRLEEEMDELEEEIGKMDGNGVNRK